MKKQSDQFVVMNLNNTDNLSHLTMRNIEKIIESLSTSIFLSQSQQAYDKQAVSSDSLAVRLEVSSICFISQSGIWRSYMELR